MDERSFGDIEISQVEADLSGLSHGTSDQSHLAPVFESQIYGQLDSVDRRGKAGDKQALLGACKDFVEFAANGALARRVTASLNVGGVLKQSKYTALFTVFRECVQVEQAVIGWRGINLEIAGMDDHAQRRMDAECNTVNQAVGNLDWIDGKRSDVEADSGPNLAQVRIVQ